MVSPRDAEAEDRRVLRLDLEYDGAGFHGWAAQPGLRTVQGELLAALRVLLREPAPALAVAGRTDAGVHASGQVASVATRSGLAPGRVLAGLNGLLPDDVAVRAVADAPPGFDARRSAVARAYEYRVLVGAPSALRRRRTLMQRGVLDAPSMEAAAALAVGRHDFRAFTPVETQHVFFDRTVTRCGWERRDDELVLQIEADAFLRHMVRTLAGSLLLVGRGTRTVAWFGGLLEGGRRAGAGPTLPPHALTLVAARYSPS